MGFSLFLKLLWKEIFWKRKMKIIKSISNIRCVAKQICKELLNETVGVKNFDFFRFDMKLFFRDSRRLRYCMTKF